MPGWPLAASVAGIAGGVVLAALLFAAVCVVCAVILALLHAVLPNGAPEDAWAEDPDAGEGPVVGS
ncbi:MAG: hypothetical protein ABR541_00170 [Candidatus Dormibacteria bacterium]